VNSAPGERLDAFGSIVGPAKLDPIGGHAQLTARNCQVERGQVVRPLDLLYRIVCRMDAL
jgi:hypothetical protein